MPPSKFADISVDDINDTYRKGYITAAQRNQVLRDKATDTLENTIQNQGILKSYFTQTVKHVQAAWDDYVKMADEYVPAQAGSKQQNTIGGAANETLQTLKNAGRVIWDQIGALTAPFTAFGEVNGAVAKRWAQEAGASPGLASTIGTVVDVGSNFVPMGKVSQVFARAVQKNVPEMAAAIGKVASVGQKAKQAEEVAAAAKATREAEQLAAETIGKGLAEDGVKGIEDIIPAAEQAIQPSDFYKALRQYHNEIKGVTETKHLKDIAAEADKLGLHLDDLKALGQGEPLTPAQISAYLKTLDEPTNNLIDAARKVVRGEPEAGSLFDRLQSEYWSYTPKFRAAEVEAGRTVKVLDADPRMKSITEMMKAWDPQAIGKMNPDAARLTMAEDWLALASDPEKLKNLQVQVASGAIQKGPTFWSQLREAYTNLLLAPPVTQVRNFLGNSFSALNSTVEREIAGWFSMDQATGVVKGEGMAQLQGYMAGMADGAKAFGDAFKRMGPEEISKLDYMPHQIPGPIGRLINIPGDALRGMDNFFKAMLKRGDIYAQALRQGVHQGLEGNALADYAARRVNVPTQAMLNHANEFALYQTFQNDLGTIGKAAQKIGQWGPLVYWFPFMKTPLNLAKYAWNRTPGLQLMSGSLYQDILAGGERADMAVARLTLSNMMASFWFGLHRQGVISDGGPIDPTLRRAWLATNQPYSFRGQDGTWYPLPAMEPATTSINLISDFSAIMNQMADPSAEQTAMAIGLSGVRDIADKTYWQSVGQVVDLIGSIRSGQEPGQTAKRLALSPVLSATTGGPLMQRLRNISDPVRREARSVVDEWMNRVPGFSRTLAPMRDGYGDPILPPAALGHDYTQIVSPFVFKPDETDPIKKEGNRLQAKIPQFPWSLGGKVSDDFDVRAAMPGDKLPVPLTSEQRDRWQVIYRNILRNPETGLNALMNRDEYKNGTWAAQREMFMDLMATARGAAKDALLLEDKDLAKAAIKSQASQVLPLIQESDRAGAEQAVTEATDLLDSLSPDEQDNLLKWGILDSGEQRDQEVIRGYRGEISKSIPDLNEAARQEQSHGAPPPPQSAPTGLESGGAR
jgi:hypothetical protein